MFAGQSAPKAVAGLLAETVERQALLDTPNQIEIVRASREGRTPVFIT
jgi:hypothetical protein